MRDGDSRAGLDERGTQEVLEIMRRERVECVITLQMETAADILLGVYSFDQARLIRHNQILARNGIDPSGVSLSRLKFGVSDLSVFRYADGLQSCYEAIVVFSCHPFILPPHI